MPSIVDVNQKYNVKLTNKIGVMNETQEIAKNKENYREWLNHNKNHATKSPNYSKMNYVFEKLKDKEEKPTFSVFGNSINSIISQKIKSHYSPKKSYKALKKINVLYQWFSIQLFYHFKRKHAQSKLSSSLTFEKT